jgi:hypothetical protein
MFHMNRNAWLVLALFVLLALYIMFMHVSPAYHVTLLPFI